jgi:hypothetical protein
LISPARDAYVKEREAQGQAPKPIDWFEAEPELEAALVADRWYVWPTILALTLAWASNAAFRWPASGLAGMLEAAAFAGLAAQQIESGRATRRALGVYAAWAALAFIGAPNLPWDAVWLVAGPAVAAAVLFARQPLFFILAVPVGLPWVQTPVPRWEVRLTQSILLLLAALVVTALWRRSAGMHLKRFWDRMAVASWIVMVLPTTVTGAVAPTLGISAIGLVVAWALRNGFRSRRGFLSVVLIWAVLQLLGLRTESGSMALRLGMILSGFLLLVMAGWRFAAARRQTLAPSRLLISPACVVPDLNRSRDYPLEIYVR